MTQCTRETSVSSAQSTPSYLQLLWTRIGSCSPLIRTFGSLLAFSGAWQRSVVLFRGEVTRCPEGQARLLLANLDQIAGDLGDGAVTVIGDDRVRIRRLPIGDDQ